MTGLFLKLLSANSQSAIRIPKLLLLLGSLLLAPCYLAQAQQPAGIPRIGILIPDSASVISARLGAFRRRLRDLGDVEGKNIVIEIRYPDGKRDRLPDLAAELVGLKVDVSSPVPQAFYLLRRRARQRPSYSLWLPIQ